MAPYGEASQQPTTTRTPLVLPRPAIQPSKRRSATDDVHHRVDQREVRERLREVAEHAPGVRVDLLREQLQRAGVGQQLLAQLAGTSRLADLSHRRHQPEGADRERTLL